jgi:hypothetical protein
MKLTREQINALIGIFISTVLAVLAVLGYDVMVAQPRFEALTAEASGVGPFETRAGNAALADRYFESLTVGKRLTSVGASALDGGITVDGTNFTVSGTNGDARFGGAISASKQTTVTVTMNGTIALSKSLIPITAAGTVATSAVNGCEGDGRVSLLRNVSANTITITDTGKLKLEGNWAAGQFDTLLLIGDGTNCLEVTRGNN